MTTGVGALRRRGPGGKPFEGEDERSESRRQAWLLAVCCVAQFMVILDLSIVNVALPSIQLSLGFSAINLQWVVDAYAILFAGFLMLGGRATDLFGQRRAFIGALALFAVASLTGGAATSQTMLIVARGAQGLAGALMAAASLAIITSSFEGPARHRAIGLWGAMNGAGGAAGTLLGGMLTEWAGWRWVLLINPPIGIAAAVVAAVVVVERRREGERPSFDLAGALSLTGGLIVLVYGIVNASALGWGNPASFGPILAGVVLLAAFPVIELRFASAPLVPLRSLTRPLRTANGIVLLFSAALFPMWYVSSLYLQQVLGLTPLATGAVFLPMTLAIMLTAGRAAALVNRFGLRAVLSSGLAMMTGGMLLLGRIAAVGTSVGYVMVPGILVAAGIGLSVVSSTIAATQGAGAEQAGLASGLVNTSRQVGGALGIALLISFATQETSHLIGSNVTATVALTHGFRVAFLLGAAFCAIAMVVTVLRLPALATAPRPKASRLAMPGAALVLVGAFAGINVATTAAPAAPIGAFTTANSYDYVSAPHLHPPKIRAVVDAAPSKLAPGFFALGNFYDLTTTPMDGQSGPLLLDNRLQPVWFRPVPTDVVASNLAQQTYAGAPVLTWWQGTITPTGATESGEDVVVDEHYHVVARLKGRDGWIPTMHSMNIVGDDAWITAEKNVPMNLATYGGATNGALADAAVQEYSLKTGKLLYSWDARDHIPLDDSHATPPTNGFPWDAYHVNAIDVVGPHTLLVSMRNTWAAYEIDTRTGKVLWTLGGKHSSYRFGPGATFQWQHDVAQHGSTITMFDDACCQITAAGTYLAPNGPSRGLVLRLHPSTHTATMVNQYLHGQSFDAAYMGDLQQLPNGNAVVGWGAQPYFSEYSPSGKLLLDAELPGPDLSYRATHVAHWVGTPTTSPAVALRRSGGRTTLYASWNGATQVASWRVLAGATPTSLHAAATVRRSGFETPVTLHVAASVYRVEALDAAGAPIGSSRLLRVGS